MNQKKSCLKKVLYCYGQNVFENKFNALQLEYSFEESRKKDVLKDSRKNAIDELSSIIEQLQFSTILTPSIIEFIPDCNYWAISSEGYNASDETTVLHQIDEFQLLDALFDNWLISSVSFSTKRQIHNFLDGYLGARDPLGEITFEANKNFGAIYFSINLDEIIYGLKRISGNDLLFTLGNIFGLAIFLRETKEIKDEKDFHSKLLSVSEKAYLLIYLMMSKEDSIVVNAKHDSERFRRVVEICKNGDPNNVAKEYRRNFADDMYRQTRPNAIRIIRNVVRFLELRRFQFPETLLI
ncbi:MAG: hypothetical protein AAFP96_08895, partial [Bacteroidota bacterium]